jgi:predicted TIM-barrel fold metal-dependent hydrolase
MIIDVRCRITIPEGGDFVEVLARQRGVPASATPDDFFAQLRAAGITTAVSVSGNNPTVKIGRVSVPDRTTSNDLMARLQARYPGQFIGVAGIDAGNTFHEALAEIDRCHALGLRAVFIEPGHSPGCDLDDRRLYPIYEKCVERNMTLIPQTSGPTGGRNIDYANPRHLDRIADDFPTLRIIAGHACYPYIREAIIVAARRENVFVSPDSYLFDMGTEDWVKAVNSNHYGVADRFLFGTAYPAVDLHSYVDNFFKLPWRADAIQKITYLNALRALDLESDPKYREVYGLGGG